VRLQGGRASLERDRLRLLRQKPWGADGTVSVKAELEKHERGDGELNHSPDAMGKKPRRRPSSRRQTTRHSG
jgi:hypothetical protein